MILKKRGLGRGLNDLGLDQLLTEFDHGAKPSVEGQLCNLATEHLQPGEYQPRKEMNPDLLEQLSNSIAEQGVIQPLLVRKVGVAPEGHDQYEIIAGERRWRAAKMAGLLEVPVVIKQVEDQAAMVVALIENIQRENLNAMEEAHALDRLVNEFGLTHEQVGQCIGRSRTSVSNFLRLMSLTDVVKQMLSQGNLDMGHARALLGLSDEQQCELAKKIMDEGLSVREVERLAAQAKEGNIEEAKAYKRQRDPDLVRLEEHLAHRMGTKVTVKHNTKGRGKITLHYKDLEDLERLLAQIEQ